MQVNTGIVADHMIYSSGVSIAANGYYYEHGQFRYDRARAYKWALAAPDGAAVTHEDLGTVTKYEKINGKWFKWSSR